MNLILKCINYGINASQVWDGVFFLHWLQNKIQDPCNNIYSLVCSDPYITHSTEDLLFLYNASRTMRSVILHAPRLGPRQKEITPVNFLSLPDGTFIFYGQQWHLFKSFCLTVFLFLKILIWLLFHMLWPVFERCSTKKIQSWQSWLFLVDF